MEGRSPLDDQLVWMAPEDLVSSPLHRRRSWGDMAGLAASLGSQGVVEPLIGRRLATGEIELVAGERRKRAAIEAELGAVPVIVRAYDDEDALEAQLAENLDREGLHPMDEAELYEMQRARGTTIERIALGRGLTAAHVKQRLQLCTLAPALRERYLAGELSHAAAFALCRLPDHEVQERAADEVQKQAEQYGHRDTELVELVDQLRDRYMLALAKAPFDISDPSLPPYACWNCPDRSGAQVELFADMEAEDHCLRPECYKAKTAANWELAAAAARDRGQEVIEGKSAEKLFSTYYQSHDGLPNLSQTGDAAYVLAEGAASYGRGKPTTWASTIKKAKADIEPVLAQGPRGQVVKLYPAKLAKRAKATLDAKAKGPKTEAEVATERDAKAAAAERRRREAARKKAIATACGDMGGLAERKAPPGLWVALAQCLVIHSYGELDATAKARALKSDELRDKVRAWDAPGYDGEARGIAVELVARRCGYLNHQGQYLPAFEALAEALGISLEALEADVTAEAKTPVKAARPSAAVPPPAGPRKSDLKAARQAKHVRRAEQAAAKAPSAKANNKKTPVTKTKTGALVRGTRGKAR